MDNLSRFIKTKNYFSKSIGRVKHNAFLPMTNEDTERFETSVFFNDSLTDQEIWDLGNEHIREKEIKARADFIITDVGSSELDIDFNNEPERHADIIGWADEKEKRKEQALKLAEKSELVLAPILNQTQINLS